MSPHVASFIRTGEGWARSGAALHQFSCSLRGTTAADGKTYRQALQRRARRRSAGRARSKRSRSASPRAGRTRCSRPSSGSFCLSGRRVYEKRHADVLRAIRDLIADDPEVAPDFRAFRINDLTGASTSYYEMTETGWMLLTLSA
jgi:hypothetical protein